MNWMSLEPCDLDSLEKRDTPMLIVFQTSMLAFDQNALETPEFRRFAHDVSLDLRVATIGWEWDPPSTGTAMLCNRIERQFRIDDYSAALPSFVLCFPGSEELHVASVSHTTEEMIDIISRNGEGLRKPNYLAER